MKTKTLWAVMKTYPWECVAPSNGVKLIPESGEPTHLIPVFKTREEAVKWAGGDEFVADLIIKDE